MKKAGYIPIIGALLISIITSCKEEQSGPEACFEIPETLYAGESIVFNSQCTGEAVLFEWTFGDGGQSTEANPSHVYSGSGTFSVTLKVTDDMDRSDVVTVNVEVMPPQIIEHQGIITEDETWIEAVHLITGDVDVRGATLTIMPGAVVRFNPGHDMTIGYGSEGGGATLIAEGTVDKPIVFTSAASTSSPGDWDFIGFYEGASNASSMRWCTIEYGGGYSENYGAVHIRASRLSMENCTVVHSEHLGISLDSEGFFSSFTNNQISDAGSGAIMIQASQAHTLGLNNSIQTDLGILVKGGDIRESVTWLKHSTPYFLLQDLDVGSTEGAAWTINPGVEIRMGGGTSIDVGYGSGMLGSVMAEGSLEEPIVFTSAASTPSPGDWDYIRFYEGAGMNSSMAHCHISYGGGYGDKYGMVIVTESGLSLVNSVLEKSLNQGIELEQEAIFTSCTGNTFRNNATYPLEIRGNYVHTIGMDNHFQAGTNIIVNDDDVDQSEVTWLNHGIPYVIDGTIDLGSATGAMLTIEAGTTLEFTVNSELRVGYSGLFGILVADGEPGMEIIFTSSAPVGFESAGDWDGIWLYDGTGNGTVFDHCTIKYGGGYGSSSGNITVRAEKNGVPEITNCEITDSGAWGIHLANGASPSMSGNTFSGNAEGNINLF